jgi:hypothetical protein
MYSTFRSTLSSLALVACAVAMVGCKGGGGGANESTAASSSSGAPVVTTPPASSSPGSATTPAPTNAPPQISGTTVSSLKSNETFSFKPAATDADGDQLSFQIQNKPAWATFSTVTGQLSGTPTTANVGMFANIVISVSDGAATTAMPAFSIAVTKAVVNTATLAWVAPTLNTDGTALNDLAGFTIVYGTSANALDQSVRIDNATASTYAMDNFPTGTYYFAVKAFTAGGAESSLSSVVSKVFN